MWQEITGDVIGDLAAVTRQQQHKGRCFGGMLGTLFFWDSSNLKTWARQWVELEQYVTLGQLCHLDKVNKLLDLQVLL